jgi:hypothetical protein
MNPQVGARRRPPRHGVAWRGDINQWTRLAVEPAELLELRSVALRQDDNVALHVAWGQAAGRAAKLTTANQAAQLGRRKSGKVLAAHLRALDYVVST